jgi:hypothetical protein
MRNELFYFSSIQCSDETLLEVIDTQEFESVVGFSLWVFIGQKSDQSDDGILKSINHIEGP